MKESDEPNEGGHELPLTMPTDDDVDPPPPLAKPLAIAGLVSLVVAAACYFAFHPDRQSAQFPLVVLGATYAALGLLTIIWLRRSYSLSLLQFRAGDITLAGIVAGLLYGLAFAAHVAMTARPPREGWIFRIYQLLGGPFSEDRLTVGLAVACIGMLEELVWRGLVFEILEPPLGRVRALVVSSLLFAAVHVPTIFHLRDELGGLNPLLPMAALGCGLVWCYLRIRTDRLLPSILSHGLFTWAVVQFPLWNP